MHLILFKISELWLKIMHKLKYLMKIHIVL